MLGTVDETDASVEDSPSSPSQITYFQRCQELAILGVTQEETDSDSERHPVVDYTGLNNPTYTAWVDAKAFNLNNHVLSWSFPEQQVVDVQRTNLLKAMLRVGPLENGTNGAEDDIITVEDVCWGELVTEHTPWWSA